jgi:hypothetical protein
MRLVYNVVYKQANKQAKIEVLIVATSVGAGSPKA